MRATRPSLAISLVATLVLLPACMSAGPGACGAEDREFFDAIEQFEGTAVEPQDDPRGICYAVFTTDAPADVVVEHYVAEFETAGWEARSSPGGEPGAVSSTIVSGYRGTDQYHVEVWAMESGVTQVSLTAGDSQS